MRDAPALLPCPFCGGKLERKHAGWFDHPKGKCILSGRAFHAGFIGQWNRRAPEPRVTVLVEAAAPYVAPAQTADFARQLRQHDALVAALAAFKGSGNS
jgi:hypothetical protein